MKLNLNGFMICEEIWKSDLTCLAIGKSSKIVKCKLKNENFYRFRRKNKRVNFLKKFKHKIVLSEFGKFYSYGFSYFCF